MTPRQIERGFKRIRAALATLGIQVAQPVPTEMPAEPLPAGDSETEATQLRLVSGGSNSPVSVPGHPDTSSLRASVNSGRPVPRRDVLFSVREGDYPGPDSWGKRS